VIVGVVVDHRWVTTADDAARAAITRSGCGHGVFSVVARGLVRQQALAIVEYAAVLAIREGAAVLDQGQGLDGFRGQAGVRAARAVARAARHEQHGEQHCKHKREPKARAVEHGGGRA
jgi:hypothetical protein